MWLIDVHTLQLSDFSTCPWDSRPKYAILSHTWTDEEVLFADMRDLEKAEKDKAKGFDKLRMTCKQAIEDGLGYVWIDTCCIDKSSSAELSEAINSMFQWYKRSAACYVYMSDVHNQVEKPGPQDHGAKLVANVAMNLNRERFPNASEFANSRWFTRGWCLQELLAPTKLEFFGSKWLPLGSLGDPEIEYVVSYASRIPLEVLRQDLELSSMSVARRLSWASNRQTSRVEDQAYSLFGLFDINLPLLYGEGERAFLRLQQEIFQKTGDQSILAWSRRKSDSHDPFAKRASQFANCTFVCRRYHGAWEQRHARVNQPSYRPILDGLEVCMRVIRDEQYTHLGVLGCYDERNSSLLLCLRLSLEKLDGAPSHLAYYHILGLDVLEVKRGEASIRTYSQFVLQTEPNNQITGKLRLLFLDRRHIPANESHNWLWNIKEVYPAWSWNETRSLCYHSRENRNLDRACAVSFEISNIATLHDTSRCTVTVNFIFTKNAEGSGCDFSMIRIRRGDLDPEWCESNRWENGRLAFVDRLTLNKRDLAVFAEARCDGGPHATLVISLERPWYAHLRYYAFYAGFWARFYPLWTFNRVSGMQKINKTKVIRHGEFENLDVDLVKSTKLSPGQHRGHYDHRRETRNRLGPNVWTYNISALARLFAH